MSDKKWGKYPHFFCEKRVNKDILFNSTYQPGAVMPVH